MVIAGLVIALIALFVGVVVAFLAVNLAAPHPRPQTVSRVQVTRGGIKFMLLFLTVGNNKPVPWIIHRQALPRTSPLLEIDGKGPYRLVHTLTPTDSIDQLDETGRSVVDPGGETYIPLVVKQDGKLECAVADTYVYQGQDPYRTGGFPEGNYVLRVRVGEGRTAVVSIENHTNGMAGLSGRLIRTEHS